MRRRKKEYIGDLVYIEFDGEAFAISTKDEVHNIHIIYIDVWSMENLLEYVSQTHKEGRDAHAD